MLSRRLQTASILVLLGFWVFWLRAPSLDVTMWNVDETIHGAAAKTLLDGGVMYRDAIDQRTPLTYYAFAGIFAFAGSGNLYAVRIVIAEIITAIAFGLYLIGDRSRSSLVGILAALAYAAFANYLLYPRDMFAAHTEWFLSLFTTAAAGVFLFSADTPSFKRSTLVGVLLGLAFLSKQPALVEIGTPLATLFVLACLGIAGWRETNRAMTGVLAGFAVIVGGVIAAFVAAGAGGDLLFYTWTYNLKYYGPEVSWRDRLTSFEPLVTSLWHSYPALLITLLLGALVLVIRSAQLKASPGTGRSRGAETYLVFWLATSFAGAMSGGRGYSHYFFQCLPPLAWLVGWTLEPLIDPLTRSRSWLRSAAGAIVAAFFLANVIWTPRLARREPRPPADPALPIADYIRAHSSPKDSLFVWGYNPDIYLYARRSPASRYLYCTFQTGLIPWTNEDPKIDTRYAIVPGAMDTLLADLARHRPAFIVDCGVGPHRRFAKYPLRNFEPLARYVADNYVEVDPATFLLRGFRLFIIRDRQPAAQNLRDGSKLHPQPIVSGPTTASTFLAAVDSTEATLTRLALEAEGTEVAAARVPGSNSLKFQVTLPSGPAHARRHLRAVADWSDGTRTFSDLLTTVPETLDTTDKMRTEFALPRVAGAVPAYGVRALINPNVSNADGAHIFNLHAPSLLRYPLPRGTIGIRGHFGIVPGAYAPDNRAPTDGATFIVRRISGGEVRVLFEKPLRPAVEPADRALQAFHLDLHPSNEDSVIEFEISPGPHGNMASDWSYWSDLMLEVSP